MPLYEYQCKKCKHKFEKIQKFSDRPIRKCPECGGPVEKIQHAPAVQFKGTGWYVTDYAANSGKSRSDGGSEKKETADHANEKSKDSKEKDSMPKKSDAKAETKSETKKAKD